MSDRYTCIEIDTDFAIHLVSPFEERLLADDVERQVAAIWEWEQRSRGAWLFNGKIFSAVEYCRKRMVGRFVP